MQIIAQDARIRHEQNGYAVMHIGTYFPPAKVSLEEKAAGIFIDKLPKGQYKDVVIWGRIEYVPKKSGLESKIVITDIIPSC